MRSPASTNPKTDIKRVFASIPEAITTFPATIALTDDFTCHHLRTVMRAKPGEMISLVDDQRERVYLATIEALQKSQVTFQVQSALPVAVSPLPPVTLAVALIKEQRWDWILQKATELGVRTIQPLFSERSVIRLSASDIPKKLERWQAVLRSAAEQSEGLFIPRIEAPVSVADFVKANTAAYRLLLRERGANRKSFRSAFREITQASDNLHPIILSIGPEGGWTETEIATFEQAGFTGVSLGERILRSETAAIAAMAAIVYETEIDTTEKQP